MPDLDDLLEKTSRTFALSIPLLPEPTRREVTIAYLLFRIADTFEDSATWSRRERIAALETFCELLEERDPEAWRRHADDWAARTPIEHEGYQELMREVPFVLDAFFELAASARERVRHHTRRTSERMAAFVARTGDDGELRLGGLEDLRDYCYAVAGIVGELCTDLFLLDRPELDAVAEELRGHARYFGEGLQLVNILKDAAFDAEEGRSYLPPGVDRETVFELARSDLGRASAYTLALQRAEADRGIVAFNALPVLLAYATLDKVEREGPGSKVSREEVYRLVEQMGTALDEGEPVLPEPGTTGPGTTGPGTTDPGKN